VSSRRGELLVVWVLGLLCAVCGQGQASPVRVAVLGLRDEIKLESAAYDRLEAGIIGPINGKMPQGCVLLTRAGRAKSDAVQALLKPCPDRSCERQSGMQLKCDYLLAADVSKSSAGYRLRMRAYDIQKNDFLVEEFVTAPALDGLLKQSSSVVDKVVSRVSAEVALHHAAVDPFASNANGKQALNDDGRTRDRSGSDTKASVKTSHSEGEESPKSSVARSSAMNVDPFPGGSSVPSPVVKPSPSPSPEPKREKWTKLPLSAVHAYVEGEVVRLSESKDDEETALSSAKVEDSSTESNKGGAGSSGSSSVVKPSPSPSPKPKERPSTRWDEWGLRLSDGDKIYKGDGGTSVPIRIVPPVPSAGPGVRGSVESGSGSIQVVRVSESSGVGESEVTETSAYADESPQVYLHAGRIWLQVPDGPVDFDAAQQIARECRLGGYTDWQLPTQSDLRSLLSESTCRQVALRLEASEVVTQRVYAPLKMSHPYMWSRDVAGSMPLKRGALEASAFYYAANLTDRSFSFVPMYSRSTLGVLLVRYLSGDASDISKARPD
jgi:hypothetical protein